MNKHTPGPWNAQRNHAETTESERINILAGKVLIAETHHAWLDWEEQEANATLIAAAPAMYEALQTLVEYLSAQVPADTLDDWKHVFAARQALTQAEGR